MRPAPDTQLAGGRYRLQRRLGAGGMATVWLAVDERLERPVAVKIVADTLAGDEQWVRRFRREAQAAAALSHRGVVPVFDYGVEDGRPYLVMEYIGGGTLADRLPRPSADGGAAVWPGADGHAPPDPETVARELLHALTAVHAAGILHRDVKPANLLFDEHGHVRLTDFGIAQQQDASALTRTGMVIGTLRYLAPEVAAGGPATIRSDLYSAGVVIGELARARPCAAVAALVAALTAEDPADRPPSAADALRLLPGDAAAPTRPTGATAPAAVAATAVAGASAAATAVTRRVGELSRTALMPRRPDAPGESGRGAPLGTSRRRAPVLYGLAGLVAVIVLVVVLATSGSGSARSGSAPRPAAAQAPVSRQVQALDRIVKSATRH